LIVTVTLNAAVDRTLTVPNFQFGHRHRASASLTSAGGKGINVARALKRPVLPAAAPATASSKISRSRGSSTISSAFPASRARRSPWSTRPPAR
jgi:hypothetical protein